MATQTETRPSPTEELFAAASDALDILIWLRTQVIEGHIHVVYEAQQRMPGSDYQTTKRLREALHRIEEMQEAR